MGILAGVGGCAPAAELGAGRVDREDEFVDITLPIADHEWSEDGSLSVIARGMIEGEQVGIEVHLAPGWKPQPIEDTPITVYWGQGHIRSIGDASDAFLALLAREYSLPNPGQMASGTAITMAGMDSDPSNLRSAPARIKIFFESGGEEAYGEAFVNIDLGSRVLEFRDKDPEYHEGILASLTAAPN